MSIYLDASVIVALFTQDHFTNRATALLASNPEIIIISDFAAVEFASLIARFVRTRSITLEQARAVLSDFDAWSVRACQKADTRAPVIARAGEFLRRMDMPLRAVDAINIALAESLDASLMTFDHKMSNAARALGVGLVAAGMPD